MGETCCICYDEKKTTGCSNSKCPVGICNDCIIEIMNIKKIYKNTGISCPHCTCGLLHLDKILIDDHDCESDHDYVEYGYCSVCWSPLDLLN